MALVGLLMVDYAASVVLQAHEAGGGNKKQKSPVT